MTNEEINLLKQAILDSTEAYVDTRFERLPFVKTEIGVIEGVGTNKGNKVRLNKVVINGEVKKEGIIDGITMGEKEKAFNLENICTDEEMRDMIFGMKVVKYVKSNAIVTVKDGVAVGIGGGQVNRIWPTQDALRRGQGATILASDAFFPFNDIVDECAKYGIKAIIQPGGSIRDQLSIDACNKHGIAMVFTGVRHFKH